MTSGVGQASLTPTYNIIEKYSKIRRINYDKSLYYKTTFFLSFSQKAKSSPAMSMAQANFCRCVLL